MPGIFTNNIKDVWLNPKLCWFTEGLNKRNWTGIKCYSYCDECALYVLTLANMSWEQGLWTYHGIKKIGGKSTVKRYISLF